MGKVAKVKDLEDAMSRVSDLREELQGEFDSILEDLDNAECCETGKDFCANLLSARTNALKLEAKISAYIAEHIK